MIESKPLYWFPAKRYGWGWGVPITWQGWAVLGAFAVLLMLGAVIFPPGSHAVPFVLCTVVLSADLIGICYRKGEPPQWRWGQD